MSTRKRLLAALLCATLTLPAVAAADKTMPSEEAPATTDPAPKSLSEKEVQQLLTGRGMGMGRPAAVQGYPGPMHVLRQAEALDLDNDQIARTGALRQRVQSASRDLGARIVEAEHELDRILGQAPVDREQMHAKLDQIADLRAELRAAHLETHLDQAELLTESQRSRMEPHSPRGGQHHGEGRQQGEGGKMAQGSQRQAMQGGKRECNCSCGGSGKRQNRNSESRN